MAARQPFNVTAAGTPAGQQQPHSPWHSPVPYLFGGLAAMLGLIAFALLILACSYWKLSGYLENQNEGGGEGERDLEAGEGDGATAEGNPKKGAEYEEEKIVVIMAGQVKPTYLATPMTSRSTSFGDSTNSTSGRSEKSCSCSSEEGGKSDEEMNVIKQQETNYSIGGSGRREDEEVEGGHIVASSSSFSSLDHTP